MGDHLQVGKSSWYVASHLGQLSLAIPPWVGTMSTSEGWDVNRHTARCTRSVVLRCKLVSGWGLMKRRSAPLYGPYGLGRTLRFFLYWRLRRVTVNVVYSLVDKDKWLHHQHGSPITVSRNQLVTRACQLCSILRYEFIFAPVSACCTSAYLHDYVIMSLKATYFCNKPYIQFSVFSTICFWIFNAFCT